MPPAGWGWLRPRTALARPAAPRLHHHGASAAAGLAVLEGRIWPAARQVSHQALVSERSRPTRALLLAPAPAEVELGRSFFKFLNNLGNACYWNGMCCELLICCCEYVLVGFGGTAAARGSWCPPSQAGAEPWGAWVPDEVVLIPNGGAAGSIMIRLGFSG